MTIDKGIFIRNIYYMLTYAFQELKYGAQYKMWHGQNVGRST